MATIKRTWEKSAGHSDQPITGLCDSISRFYTKCTINIEGVNREQPVVLKVTETTDKGSKILYSGSFNLKLGEKKQIGPFTPNKNCRISVEGSLSGWWYHWSDCRIESILEYDESAMKTLRMGVFFDGTGNNAYNGMASRNKLSGRLGDAKSKYLYTKTSIIPKSYIFTKDFSKSNVTSNVWKLYESFSEGSLNAHLHQAKTYVEGVGTSRGEEDSLFTMGTGWSAPFTKQTGVIAKTDDAIVQIRSIMDSLQEHFDRIELCVYGFSRGAAAARHFVNRVKKQDQSILALFAAKVTSLPEVKLVGLFDTVASILALSEGDLDAGSSATGAVDITMDDAVSEDVFHITAGHEERSNFSLNHVTPTFVKELRLPGAHADIGGGYEDVLMEKLLLTDITYTSSVHQIPLQETECYKRADAARKKLLAHPQWGKIYKASNVHIASTMLEGHWVYYTYSSAVQIERNLVYSGLDHIAFQAMRRYSETKGIVFQHLPKDRVEQIPADLVPLSKAAFEQVDKIAKNGGGANLVDAISPELGAKYVHHSFCWDEDPTWWEIDGTLIVNLFTFNLTMVNRPNEDGFRREYHADGRDYRPMKSRAKKLESQRLGA